jgi:tartrate-resistant acid phosphatase type 5
MRLSFLALATFALLGAEASLSFISLGDWGARRHEQSNVAHQMDKVATKSKVSFVMALGDNFYNNGVASDTDSQWQTTYRDVYNMKSLQVPWFPVLGNHDYHQNPDAQIQYYHNKRDHRWTMPGHYYSQTFNQDGFSVQILFIDTIYFAPHQSGGTHVDNQPAKAKAQLDWLKQELAASKATYLLVAGHYPVFSDGGHGDCDENAKVIKALLEQHKVDAYICGHDHSMQHMSNNGIEFFVSGGGAFGARVGFHTKAQKLHFSKAIPGFMLHQADAHKLVTTIIDENGHALYSYTINAKRSNDLPSNIVVE